MKFLVLNVDFSSPQVLTPCIQQGLHTRVSNRGTPWKVVIFSILACPAWKWFQIGTDMLLIITGTGDLLYSCINVNDFEW